MSYLTPIAVMPIDCLESQTALSGSKGRTPIVVFSVLIFLGAVTEAALDTKLSASEMAVCQANEDQNFNSVRLENLSLPQQLPAEITDKVLATAFRQKSKADHLLALAGLPIPPDIHVEAHKALGAGIYLYDRNLLRFTVFSVGDPDWFKKMSDPDEQLTGPAFIHEYGHAVFWNALGQIAVPWNRLKSLSQYDYCLRFRVTSAQEQGEYFKWREGVFFKRTSSNDLYLYALHQIVQPYTEFYSDLLAALLYDNPSVMNVPINPYVADTEQEDKNRDFTLVPLVHAKTTEVNAALDEHEVFAEARHRLWLKAWKGKLLSDDDKVKILRNVHHIMMTEIERRWKQGSVIEDRKVANGRLIKSFESAF